MVTSKGIKPLRMEEEEEDEHGSKKRGARTRARKAAPHMVDDPHAWQNLVNGKLYVKNIVAGSPRPIRPVPGRTGRQPSISARLTSWTPR